MHTSHWALIATLVAAAAVPDGRASAADAFVDATPRSGIAFRCVNGASGKKYLIETMLGGAAWLDYDGDGLLDLYLVQGHRHPEAALDGPGGPDEPSNVLYRNLGGGKFEDVTVRSGTGDRGYGMGAAAADYDADGRPDLYVTNYGRNTLYHNRGDGKFDDVTESAGVGAGGWSSSAAWADFDGDGRLDLYVARYLVYDTHKDSSCPATAPGSKEKVPTYCNPTHFEGAPDLLFQNRGDGTFRDVSKESGVGSSHGWQEAKGLGVVASDFDGDGDLDVLVANDSVPNTLWKNLGGLRFENVALVSGFALNAEGAAQAGMGIARGDVDGDGDEDIYVTNFSRETDTLYLNQGSYYLDATIERGIAQPTYLPLAFGTRLLDYDLDGDLDVYVANGHILDNAERLHAGEGITYAQPALLFENDGRGRFQDASSRSGAWFQRAFVGRGVAECDYDNDGDPDLVVVNIDGPAVLLENHAGNGKPWIGVDLRASTGGPTVHGARVEVECGGMKQVRYAGTDGSYLSSHDPRIRFALPGSAGQPVTVKVRWPEAREAKDYPGLTPGKYHVISR